MNTKRFLAFALSLMLVFAVALPANATQEKKYSTFLVLGDSISTGYGLEGYKTTDPETNETKEDFIANVEAEITSGSEWYGQAQVISSDGLLIYE